MTLTCSYFFTAVRDHKLREYAKNNLGVSVAVPAATPTIDKATLYKWEDSLKRCFSGECHEGNGYYLKLFVYITDTGKVRKVTEILRRKYDGRFSEAFDIWYFDMLSSNTSFCSVPKNE